MRGLLADSGRGRITGHDSIADAQRVGALQDQLHGEHVLGLGLAALDRDACAGVEVRRSEEHTSELQSLMRISYAVFCLKKKKKTYYSNKENIDTAQTHII